MEHMSTTGIFDFRKITMFKTRFKHYVSKQVSLWENPQSTTEKSRDPYEQKNQNDDDDDDDLDEDPVETNKSALEFFIRTFLTPLMFNMIMDHYEMAYSRAQQKRIFQIETESKFGALSHQR